MASLEWRQDFVEQLQQDISHLIEFFSQHGLSTSETEDELAMALSVC